MGCGADADIDLRAAHGGIAIALTHKPQECLHAKPLTPSPQKRNPTPSYYTTFPPLTSPCHTQTHRHSAGREIRRLLQQLPQLRGVRAGHPRHLLAPRVQDERRHRGDAARPRDVRALVHVHLREKSTEPNQTTPKALSPHRGCRIRARTWGKREGTGGRAATCTHTAHVPSGR
jgi:hypothetical protein